MITKKQGLSVVTHETLDSEKSGGLEAPAAKKKSNKKESDKRVPVEDTVHNCWRYAAQTEGEKTPDPILCARVTNFGAISLSQPITSVFSRIPSSEAYFGLISFSNGKKRKFICPKLDAQPNRFLDVLIQQGADCPVPSKALGHAVSEQFIRQAKEGGQVFTIPGWCPSLKAFVCGNGIIKDGAIYPLDPFKQVLDREGKSFVHDLNEGHENYSSFPHFPEHVFVPQNRSNTADILVSLWKRLGDAGIGDLTCAHVIMFTRTFLSIDDIIKLKLAYGIPSVFIAGAMGSGKTETVGDLTQAYFFIDRQNVSAGSTYANARNKLCERALPIFFEEAHRKDTKCSLHNDTFATDLRRIYRGSDLSNANHSYKAIGFPIFDGINDDNLPADLKERLYFVNLPWSSKTRDQSVGDLIKQIKEATPVIQSCVVENLINFTSNPQVYELSLERGISKWTQALQEDFNIKGRDAWPALVMAVAEISNDLFGWLEPMKAWLQSFAKKKRDHALPRLEEFLAGLLECDTKRPMRFETDQDIECVIGVPNSSKSIVRVNISKAITMVSQLSSLGQNINKKHLLEELGLGGKEDKDPTPSAFRWAKRDRDKTHKGSRPRVLGGARYIEFCLSDPDMPEAIKEPLEQLAVKSWPTSSPFGETETLAVANEWPSR